ncbi:MAG: ABC transporter permease [Alloacidobacterium sp.]|jgi:putative ABC transport system permease protein
MTSLLQDVRYSLRQLKKTPGFTITAIISLTLGIGATTAVFSVVYAILMNPYPYANSDRMAHLRATLPSGLQGYFGLTASEWQVIRKSPVVEDAFMTDEWSLTVTGHDLPEDVQADYVTSNTFNFMGVPPLLGRGILPSDAIDGQDPQPVAVLGYKFWQRHFNGDPSVIGKTIQLVRKNYTIIGVAASRFTWDDGDVYLPLKVTPDPVRAYYVGIRLKPGVSHAAANAALAPLIDQFKKESPDHFPRDNFKFHVQGLNEDFVQRLGGTLYLLLGAVALLLAIGCGNVSILLLARGTARQHEFALRSAIGATRRRIIRQLLTESLLLSLTGAALGVLLAYQVLALIVKMLPQYSFPHEASIQINLPVLLFSVAISLFTGIVFGLSPALQYSRPDVTQVMQSASRTVSGSIRGRATNSALIAGQIALTLLLLASAGAAIRNFLRLLHTPLGYDPHNIMSVGIPIHDGTYKTWPERAAFFESLKKKITTVPGVTMNAISSNATPPNNGYDTGIEILGQSPRDDQKVRINLVSPEYFPILHIPLAQGRIWDETENHNAAHVAIINQTMARRYFPKGNALGHSFKVPEIKDVPPFSLTPQLGSGYLEIIGIIADKRDDGLRNPILPEVFLPYTLNLGMYTQILVHSNVPPLSLLHSIAAQVNSVDPDQQITSQVRDLDHWISTQPEWEQENLVAWLFGAFAILALALAAVGLYSVVSYIVAQRTNEFGIRMALGAQRAHVLRIVFISMVTSVASGIAVGLALTLAFNKLLARWLEDSSHDSFVLLGVTLLLSIVAAIACVGPARRASKIDPMKALRCE